MRADLLPLPMSARVGGSADREHSGTLWIVSHQLLSRRIESVRCLEDAISSSSLGRKLTLSWVSSTSG